ncbi:MAG TPA: hypothetical protein V6D14_31120 [Coleofasciculaceae cyanobacterium]|jgi:hypothetical protein
MDNFIIEGEKNTHQELELIFKPEPRAKAEKAKFVLWLSRSGNCLLKLSLNLSNQGLG